MQSPTSRFIRMCSVVALGALALTSACSDAPLAPKQMESYTPPVPNSSVFVTVATTGEDPDTDGYVLSVGDRPDIAVHSNDSIQLKGLPFGRRTARLSGLDLNCTSDSLIKMLDPVTPESRSETKFAVSCVGSEVPPNAIGTKLLFVREARIYSTIIGSSNVASLTTGENPVWSPDGERIAFSRGESAYVMDANGTNERVVATKLAATDYAGHMSPAWSPDGHLLSVVNSDSRIMIVSVDSGPRADTVTSIEQDVSESPIWSPDGKHLLFETTYEDGWGVYQPLWIGDMDGSRMTGYRGFPTDTSGVTAWSPDGNSIAIVRAYGYNTDNLAHVALMGADGSQSRNLVAGRSRSRPAWSPDGKMVAYVNSGCADYRCPSSILYVSTDGTQNGVLVANAHSPSWHR